MYNVHGRCSSQQVSFFIFLIHIYTGHLKFCPISFFRFSFWMAVENLKLVKHTELHRSAEEIYQVYVVPSSDKSVMLDTTLIRGMEQYLQGTHGLQAFFEAQKRAYKNLEEKYYRKFVLSEEYLMFVCQSEAELDDLRAQRRDEDDSDNEDDDDDDEVKLVKFTIM